MERQTQVVDASIVVKWFLREEDSEKARTLRKDSQEGKIKLVVPELLFLEVLNVLQGKGGTEAQVREAQKILWDMQFEIIAIDENLLTKTIELSMKYRLTMYDALYAAVAQFHDVPLITADVQLSKVPNAILLRKT